MTVLMNVDKIPVMVRTRVMWFCNAMRNIHGENLVSIVLYGSAVNEMFDVKRSNINLALVFKEINVETMKKSLRIIEKGRKKNIVAPLFLTEEHVTSSCDTFPMEFQEIKNNHIVVNGDDVFSQLSIDNKNLRLECEQQIKSLIIKLRQSYLEVGLARKGIEKLIHESFRSLLPIMRAVLQLKGESVPLNKETLILQCSSLASLAPSIFMMVHKDKAGDEKIGKRETFDFFSDYLTELYKLARFVDRM